ncbi:uncharacterized protein ACIB01_015565 isoform 1-T2 [Guaruba guarouba]
MGSTIRFTTGHNANAIPSCSESLTQCLYQDFHCNSPDLMAIIEGDKNVSFGAVSSWSIMTLDSRRHIHFLKATECLCLNNRQEPLAKFCLTSPGPSDFRWTLFSTASFSPLDFSAQESHCTRVISTQERLNHWFICNSSDFCRVISGIEKVEMLGSC